MSENSVAWAGVASLVIHLVQGGVQLARHFKLTSECCGRRSGIAWDVSADSPDKSSSASTEGVEIKAVRSVSFREPPAPIKVPL